MVILHIKLPLLWGKIAACWCFAEVSAVFLVFVLVRHFEQIPSLQTPTTLVVRTGDYVEDEETEWKSD